MMERTCRLSRTRSVYASSTTQSICASGKWRCTSASSGMLCTTSPSEDTRTIRIFKASPLCCYCGQHGSAIGTATPQGLGHGDNAALSRRVFLQIDQIDQFGMGGITVHQPAQSRADRLDLIVLHGERQQSEFDRQ